MPVSKPETVSFGGTDFELYIPKLEIDQSLAALAVEIGARYEGLDPYFVSVERGGRETRDFVADQLGVSDDRRASVRLKSYHEDESTGVVILKEKLNVPAEGEDLIFFDDIDDKRLTLRALRNYAQSLNARSFMVAVAFSKLGVNKNGVAPPDLIAMNIEDYYVIGRGLDTQNIDESRSLESLYRKVEADRGEQVA